MSRVVKREKQSGSASRVKSAADGDDEASGVERRVLRSKYLAVKNLISDGRDDLSKVDSDKFKSIFDEVESLHQLVQKPREQVADAEALLDITNTLMNSVRAQNSDGVTAADFVSCLLKDFGQQGAGSSSMGEVSNSVSWKEIGLAVSHIFTAGPGCCTMLGPMNTELKQRKAVVQRKRTRQMTKDHPEELDEGVSEERTETDKNIATMFGVLRSKRKVRLENLVLNRRSFAQTVENIFALSFLLKDGRVDISVDEKGCHLLSPRNAPSANEVASREVRFNHFVFNFSFKDWKLMQEIVGVGEELMPYRNSTNIPSSSRPDSLRPEAEATQPDSLRPEAEATLPSTPIRKFSRNRGLVLQDQAVVENSPESGDSGTRSAAIRKKRRKLT